MSFVRQEMPGIGDSSTNSLTGLENSIPPRSSIGVKLSYSDLNKPLPLIPTEEGYKSRSSSLYSTAIDEFIGLYLDGSTSSRVSSEDARLSSFEHHQLVISHASRLYGNGKYTVSESALRDTTSAGQITAYDSSQADEVTIRYRYSNPEGQSPIIKTLTTYEHPCADSTWIVEPAKRYRDTLLPTPFTPVSVKCPNLFPEIIPLRGPRILASSPSTSAWQSQAVNHRPTNNLKGTLNEKHSKSGTYDPSEKNSQVHQTKTHDGRSPWNQNTTVHSEMPSQERSLIIHGDYTQSKAQASEGPRPAASSYSASQQASFELYLTRSSSSSTQFCPVSSYDRSLPRNWSSHLKPSNPAVARVPRSERSPAVGLSAYQILGPKAWETNKQKEHKKNKPLQSGEKRSSKHFISKLKNLDLRTHYTPLMDHQSYKKLNAWRKDLKDNIMIFPTSYRRSSNSNWI